MLKAIKKALQSKKILDNREGRFLTVYLQDGKVRNGKVLRSGYLRSTVQIASTGAVIKVKNASIRLVSTDHTIVTFK